MGIIACAALGVTDAAYISAVDYKGHNDLASMLATAAGGRPPRCVHERSHA